MTHAPADIGLSPDAADRFDDYLRQTRAALARSPDVNPDDIEADIREHVERELLGAPRPVPLAALDAVLARLGPPSQWGTGDDPTLWFRATHLLRGARTAAVAQARRVRFTLWSGPEDWRLAYLSFGVFALGVLTFGVLLPVCLPVSYLLSRAGLAHAREKGLVLGTGRKWLLYPPVVLVSATLLIAAIVWPAGLGIAAAQEVSEATYRVQNHDRPESVRHPSSYQRLREKDRKERWAAQLEEDRKLLEAIPASPTLAPAAAGLFVGAGAALIWWTVLGAIVSNFPGTVRAVFCPLCDALEPRHGTWLAVPCLILLIPWIATTYDFVAALK
ncbi:hypothetical protein [Frigoriglobus tundricola]|uniref:Uncharacterized protein n=1 Tax=Frigoriglobus tundricola TaxID=2774151 RepID=A0A6M5YSZ4_9BACT|nr:hypothetical protein [Frigoriglobus tundricola]QJW96530.1 hypothetical protein FTUN_4087 [Frigoriglobus tundricola]